MVGGDDIDGAVLQSGQNALHVLTGAQGGIDPGHRALGEYLVLGEPEILGAGLTGQVDALLLHLADDVYAAGGGHVADVDVGPGLLGQHGIPHDHQLLGNSRSALQPQLAGYAALVHRPTLYHRGILAVAQHGHIQTAGPDQHVPHQIGVVHVAAVVRQGDGPRLF